MTLTSSARSTRVIVTVAVGAATSLQLLAQARPRNLVAQPGKVQEERRVVRMPDGRPDLSGVWTYGTTTPLERPPRFAGRRVVTDAEALEFAQQAANDRRALVASRIGIMEVDDGARPWLKINGENVTSIVIDPADGRLPALTPGARRRFEQLDFDRLDSADDVALSEGCIRGLAGPPLLPNVQFPNVQIVQTSQTIALRHEQEPVRIVTLDSRGHLSPAIRTWLGDARGRWENDTLVIDSTNFRDAIAQRPPTNRASDSLHIVERFTPLPSGPLRYEFVVEDPATFVSPWSGELRMRRMDGPLYEIACHEGNCALANMLRGARVQDANREIDKHPRQP